MVNGCRTGLGSMRANSHSECAQIFECRLPVFGRDSARSAGLHDGGAKSNHGVLILLDGRPCNAPDEGPPYISVNAFYNAAGEAENAAGLAAIQCRWKNARDIVWLKGQLLGGRHAAGCRRRFEDGHIEVSYIVLRRTAQSYLTWIEIGADLVTTPARYQSDMRTFRRVLRGIWIHTDGPQR